LAKDAEKRMELWMSSDYKSPGSIHSSQESFQLTAVNQEALFRT